jgi:hypothetical protein
MQRGEARYVNVARRAEGVPESGFARRREKDFAPAIKVNEIKGGRFVAA